MSQDFQKTQGHGHFPDSNVAQVRLTAWPCQGQWKVQTDSIFERLDLRVQNEGYSYIYTVYSSKDAMN